jgi:hypothetical protein
MISPRLGAPVTVLYRGDLSDTASLVGLALSRASVEVIAFTGEMTKELAQYWETLNPWLRSKGLPNISIHPTLTPAHLDRVIDRAHQQWGWGQTECEAALRLAGLPLPPSQVAS